FDNLLVQRDGKYSCGLLLRRPRSDPSRLINPPVDMTLVVYDQRPLALSGTTFQPTGENVFAAPMTGYSNGAGSTTSTLIGDAANGQEKPAFRRGDWLLDGSLELVAPLVAPSPLAWPPPPASSPPYDFGWTHANFYRIVGITEPAAFTPPPGFGAMDLEIQTP